MQDIFEIFVAGIAGVFIGLGVLYIAIRLTSMVTDRLSRGDARNE